jgi:hypothetical protein
LFKALPEPINKSVVNVPIPRSFVFGSSLSVAGGKRTRRGVNVNVEDTREQPQEYEPEESENENDALVEQNAE